MKTAAEIAEREPELDIGGIMAALAAELVRGLASSIADTIDRRLSGIGGFRRLARPQ
jgi:hypothetical protein